jgi:hypothetical protein
LVERLEHAGKFGDIVSFERVNEYGARHVGARTVVDMLVESGRFVAWKVKLALRNG